MNDFMSLGIHRLWKDHFVRSLNPGSQIGQKGWNILDKKRAPPDVSDEQVIDLYENMLTGLSLQRSLTVVSSIDTHAYT
jgi:hypothetical protein